MGRREQREQIFILLFQVEFNNMEEMPQQVQLYFEQEEQKIGVKDKEYISEKLSKIEDKLGEIDTLLNEVTTGWETNRIGKVELTILRLAVYEMKFDDSVPTGVAINEAVELAKKFGQDESSSFVNGVLAKIV